MVKSQNVDTAALDEQIEKSGLKLSYIIEQLGITRQAFDQKRKGRYAFRQSEMYVLCDLLKIDAIGRKNIFFPDC